MPASAIENSIYPMALPEFKAFREMIHQHTGIWLHDGKQVMLASRLSRRLRHFGFSDFAEYYDLVKPLAENSDEVRELINCITTNKTSFFRERHHFDFLANNVIPEARHSAAYGVQRNFRVWSAACSTGEEPYTIAITLLEALQSQQKCTPLSREKSSNDRPGFRGLNVTHGSWKLEVVASDIDTTVLNTARHGIYNADSLESIAPSLQKKYFLRGRDDMHGRVKVKPEIAKLVNFSRINLKENRWPLEGQFDAIFFRNALIYFKQQTQDIFLRKMIEYLKPRGYLFLGNSEHVPWLHNILEPLNQTTYQLRETAR